MLLRRYIAVSGVAQAQKPERKASSYQLENGSDLGGSIASLSHLLIAGSGGVDSLCDYHYWGQVNIFYCLTCSYCVD
jgi:hypothetical protein